MIVRDIRIDPEWKQVLEKEFSKPYFAQIKQYLVQEKKKGKLIFPPGHLLFHAFDATPFSKVRVVILGQDPYHQPGQAMGLCFSVPPGKAIPASLVNIYKELERDLHIPRATHGDLTSWTRQGVFLLNAILTVPQNEAGAHQRIGWQVFTDAVIKSLSDQREGLIFLLWGNFAKSKKTLIDIERHHVLEAVHPSPLAGGKFIGCGHFSQTNNLLAGQQQPPIYWQLPTS